MPQATIIDFVDDDKVKVVLLDKRKGLTKSLLILTTYLIKNL